MYASMPSRHFPGQHDIVRVGAEDYPEDTVRSARTAIMYVNALNANTARVNVHNRLGVRIEITARDDFDAGEELRAKLSEGATNGLPLVDCVLDPFHL